MTQKQISNLETKVAVIQNDVNTLKEDTKSVKSLLKWFIVLTFGVLSVITTNTIINSGEKKLMQSIIEHNSIVIGDMAAQGIENGWFNPDENTYRTGKDE